MPLFIDVDSFHYSVSGSRKVHILTSERWDSLQYGSHQFLNWWLQHPTGMLRFSHSSPTPHTKKEAAPKGSLFFGARDGIGLFEKHCHTNGFSDFRASNFFVLTSLYNGTLKPYNQKCPHIL